MYINKLGTASNQAFCQKNLMNKTRNRSSFVRQKEFIDSELVSLPISFKGLIIGSGKALDLINVDKSDKVNLLDTQMKKVLSKVKYSNVYNDHDGAVETLLKAKQDKVISFHKPVTLLHFDTHSDIKKNNEPVLHIGNWINTAMSMGVIGEIYWILPDWTKNDEWKDSFWNEGSLLCQGNDSVANVMLDAPSEKVFYYEKKTGKIHFSKPVNYDLDSNSYFPIQFHKVTIDDLPNMKNRDNVMLDICGDYFVNSGMSTVNKANNITTIEENSKDIENSFNEIFTQFEAKKIQPTIYTAAKSPGFVPDEHLSQVSRCLNRIDNIVKNRKEETSFSLII